METKENSKRGIFHELQKYIDFYDSFVHLVFLMPTIGTSSYINLDTYVYSSISETLKTLKYSIENERIGDAYTLLRKYYETSIVNIYTNIYLDENYSINQNTVHKINNWLLGIEKISTYREIIGYIKKSQKLKNINLLLIEAENYKKIKNRCNDYMHMNFFKHIMQNIGNIRYNPQTNFIEILRVDIKNIFILHLSYIFYIRDYYMRSNDYMDAIEAGCTPENQSEFWVAPFLKEIFNEFILTNRPDVAELIIKNTQMHLQHT